MLFFDRKPGREKVWTDRVWYYNYRTNIHHTLKQNPVTRPDLDEFVDCFHPSNRHERQATRLDVIPREIVEDLEAALEQFRLIAEDLSESA